MTNQSITVTACKFHHLEVCSYEPTTLNHIITYIAVTKQWNHDSQRLDFIIGKLNDFPVPTFFLGYSISTANLFWWK